MRRSRSDVEKGTYHCGCEFVLLFCGGLKLLEFIDFAGLDCKGHRSDRKEVHVMTTVKRGFGDFAVLSLL